MVSIANVEQARGWDGDDGDHWTRHEEHYNASIRPHGLRLLDAAQISPEDRILDIGCGCGESTRAAARVAVSGSALGVDLSARMIERARERSRAEGLTNTTFEQGDAQVYAFEAQAFDLAISRTGAMFFADFRAAFANIGCALRSGGRLSILSWQELRKNEWLKALRGALAVGRALPEPPVGAPGPFGLSDPNATRRILTEAGFGQIQFEEVNEPIRLGANADDSYGFLSTSGMVRGLLNGLDETGKFRALEELRATLAAHDTGAGVRFDSCAWLITARKV
ncbi:MAG: class I SAM-dependent methyltransferase [Chloroflexi bacterium]|nr:class I SAM-dependent methyltransferase [Chloroflexota bacterium]